MPVLVVPGTDPEHPAEVAALYQAWLPRCTIGDPAADLAEMVAAFASSCP